jgi:hypothetical protein
MANTLVPQFFGTVNDIMNIIAPNKGGTIPASDSEEYAQWFTAIKMKYEEASRRGFWRRLLKKDDTQSLRAGDESIIMPDDFQRANSLYIFAVNGIDLADPDRTPDDQSVFAQMITDPEDEDFGKWQLNFQTPIETDTSDVMLWYFATPPMPSAGIDTVLLPGDMIAFGAMTEIFRASNLQGSQDDARLEYENRLQNYLALEMIPPRNEILKFETNPRHTDRTVNARAQYSQRQDRVGRNY